LLRNYERERDLLLQKAGPMGYSSGTSYVDADCIKGTPKDDFIETVKQLQEFEIKIANEKAVISSLQEDIKALENKIECISDLEAKVKEKRFVVGKSIKQIALEEKYSYAYIRRLVRREK
jgi:hypothetical protein